MKTDKEISLDINITMELKQLLQRRLSATERFKTKGHSVRKYFIKP